MKNLLQSKIITPLSFLALLIAGTSHAGAQEADHFTAGIGAWVAPAIQGSEDYRVIPLPVIDVKHGPLFVNLRDGVGVTPLDSDHVTIGVSAVFLQGYRRRDVPAGVDKLSDGVGARAFVNLRSGGFVTTVGVVKGVSDQTKGVVADASLAYPIHATPRLTLVPAIATTWADAKYNDGYFGIHASEAAASGLNPFAVGSGFKDITGAVTASFRLTDRVTLSATGGVTRLVGDAQDSPLVDKKTRPTGLFSLSYRL